MKPFNLQEALDGKPVVTRDGQTVKIAGYNPDAKTSSKVVAWVNGEVRCFYDDGLHCNSGEDNLDLFMAEKPKVKKEGWINLYRQTERIPGVCVTSKIVTCGNVWGSEEFANNNIGRMVGHPHVATIKIEWEEEL